MLSDCLHSLTALGADSLPVLLGAMLLAGLAAGVTHCAGMCGPFVLAQAMPRANAPAAPARLARLAGAALLPYHAGRMLGYGLLGALAGGSAGLASAAAGLRLPLALLLALAALLMLAQALPRLATLLPRLRPPPLPALLQRRVGALLASPGGWRGVLLGLLLSALPCGVLYAALAGAAATGSALAGALAMGAFVLGTMPALIAVAVLGQRFGGLRSAPWRLAGGLLFVLNGVVLGGMALRVASGG